MTSSADFVHLHVHSDYSLIDGAAKTEALAKAAKKNGQIAVALTDHGSVSGTIDFWKACNKEDVKPIIGCEAYLAPGLDDLAHTRRGIDKDGNAILNEKGKKRSFDYDHFTLIAKNLQGWHNLRKLSSIASLEGFYYRPRMSWALLTKYHEGLIALSGCLSGQLSNSLKVGKTEEAEAHARRWKDLFGDDYYVELQPVVDLPGELHQKLAVDQAKANDGCLAIARKLGIKTVATADVHYVEPKDSSIQEVKICVNSYKTLEENRTSGLNMPPVFYFKSSEEMQSLFRHYPEAALATREIADKVEKVKVLPGKYFLPKFQTPDGSSSVDYFRRLCWDGLVRRYGVEGSFGNAGRLQYEMTCIEKMGFVDYFLVTQDFTSWARNNGVPVGPGRGSAAGSIVSYCLGITNIDPLRYGLLFERFLNPERVSMPDIDIDFDERGRGRVIEYVKQKYGEKCVAQIITFGESKAKSAIRDVGRVLDMSHQEVNRVAKLIPEDPKAELKDCLETIPELKAMQETDAGKKHMFELALGLEGLYRSEGKHAAGVVIADTDLMERIPLKKVPPNKEDSVICTAFSMEQVEEVGLLKMDFLGLRTITQIYDTVALIKDTTGKEIDPDSIPVRDNHSMETTAGAHRCHVHEVAFEVCRCCDKTLSVFMKAETNGVFQVEGAGMKKLLKQMKPDRFDDLIALVALFRPGPLGSGMDQDYVLRKSGEQELVYEHPKLEPITKETYGVWCYQEQLMQLSVALAGFTLPQADELRKATAKKKPEAMTKIKDKFIPGCVKHGVSEELAKAIWEKIVFFSEYSFNKSHSAAYGLISWHTAWLKANYPIEFMAALLTSWSGSTDKLALYVDEIRRLGIPLEPPDVNESSARFTVRVGPTGDRTIIYGLDALKGVGSEAVRTILEARAKVGRFTSIFHFCEVVDLKAVTSAVLDTLAKAGAFRSTGATRAQILESTTRIESSRRGAAKEINENAIEAATRLAKQEKKERASGQTSLFQPNATETSDTLPQVAEWSLNQALDAEREALGLYLTGHPLEEYSDALAEFATVMSARVSEVSDTSDVIMGGVVRSVKKTLSKSGEEMAFITLEDLSGKVDAVAFPGIWEKHNELFKTGNVLFLQGDLDMKRDTPSLKIGRACDVKDGRNKFADPSTVIINLWNGSAKPEDLEKVKVVLTEHAGGQQRVYHRWWFRESDHHSAMKQFPQKVRITRLFREELGAALGSSGSFVVKRE